MNLTLWLLKAGLTGIVLIGAVVWAFSKGKEEREIEQLKTERVKNAQAKTIQDRVAMDSSFRDRVRRKFDQS